MLLSPSSWVDFAISVSLTSPKTINYFMTTAAVGDLTWAYVAQRDVIIWSLFRPASRIYCWYCRNCSFLHTKVSSSLPWSEKHFKVLTAEEGKGFTCFCSNARSCIAEVRCKNQDFLKTLNQQNSKQYIQKSCLCQRWIVLEVSIEIIILLSKSPNQTLVEQRLYVFGSFDESVQSL